MPGCVFVRSSYIFINIGDDGEEGKTDNWLIFSFYNYVLRFWNRNKMFSLIVSEKLKFEWSSYPLPSRQQNYEN